MSSPIDYRAVREALAMSGLPPLQRLVVHALLEHVHMPLCMPSIARLASETGCPERSLKRHIAALERAGWLVVERQRGAHNVYWITIPTGADPGQPGPELGPSTKREPGPNPGPTRAKSGANPGQALAPYVRDIRYMRECARAREGSAASPPRRASRQRRPLPETPLPADFAPSEDDRRFAAERGLDLAGELYAFRRYYAERTAKSWPGRWATWLRRADPARPPEPREPRQRRYGSAQPDCGLTGWEALEREQASQGGRDDPR